MSRPVGVTASAIVAILGSIIALLFAALLAASPTFATAQPQPPYSTQIAIVGAAITAALAALGIWTGIGVFRLRSWARTSVRERMFEMQRTFTLGQQNPMPLDQGVMLYLTVAFATILASTAIYFLIRNRAAFVRSGF